MGFGFTIWINTRVALILTCQTFLYISWKSWAIGQSHPTPSPDGLIYFKRNIYFLLRFLCLSRQEVNAQDKVDFSPVYRCLHIYSVLGERDVFESYYRKQRAKQSKLAIQPQGNMVRIYCYLRLKCNPTDPIYPADPTYLYSFFKKKN